jgi:hypothetical protein
MKSNVIWNVNRTVWYLLCYLVLVPLAYTSIWHWGSFSPSTSVSPANSHSTDYSTVISIYHLGLVQ